MSETNKIKVLLVKPEKQPEIIEIAASLESMQQIVGGYIQAIYPFEDNVVIVCNEEGKLNGDALNRALRDKEGRIYDILAGDFFIAYVTDESEEFLGLPDNLAEKYFKLFKNPERFMRVGNEIIAVSHLEREVN